MFPRIVLEMIRGAEDVSFFGVRVGALESQSLFAILWSIWKESNSSVFGVHLVPRKDVLSLVSTLIARWVSIRRDFDSPRINGIFHN